MDKELFKDKNPLLRRQMLEDNCAAVERITYTSPFSEEEMGERKTELANIDLDMAALEEEKKAFMQAYKDKLKPKKERKKNVAYRYKNVVMRKLRMNALSLWIVAPVPPDITMVMAIWLKNVRWRHKRCKTVFEDIESTGTEG